MSADSQFFSFLRRHLLLCAVIISWPCVTRAERLPLPNQSENDWPQHGRTSSEQRYSPLSDINRQTIGRLGLAWHRDFDTERGQEGTPLVVGHTMYLTTNWSHVEALDATNGAVLWRYDPVVPGDAAAKGCCDTVNRGAAYAGGRVFVGTFDARLIALDSRTGHVLWSVDTIPHDADLGDVRSYTIDGAPRIAGDVVIIGNGGAEFGARGFVSAYSLQTGALRWRFFTVPNPRGRPDHAASDPILKSLAERSWTPGSGWTHSGGGGTVWDGMLYDPQTDLLYLGVGNGSPWNYKIRSDGKGDNLFLASIVAVRPETGAYVWHFQETPQDQWDYTASQPMMTLDLRIDGRRRHVLIQAPKNGLFYMLDAQTGAFLSATPFTFVNWTHGVDPVTGRPHTVPDAMWSITHKPWLGIPGSLGAHNWAPMSFSPRTGYVYIPSQQIPQPFQEDRNFKLHSIGVNLGIDMAGLPSDPKVVEAVAKTMQGWLLAWDPVARRAAFRVEHAAPWNGGVLSTGGDLVFQGLSDGHVEAYDATDGKRLFSFDAHGGIVAPPISYKIGGTQYVAVESGWGGIFPLIGGALARAGTRAVNHSRLLVFALDGHDTLPPETRNGQIPIPPPPIEPNQARAAGGYQLYQSFCFACHGDNAIAAGVLPDLRWSGAIASVAGFNGIVAHGALSNYGMVGFSKVLSDGDIEAIRQYLLQRANDSYPASQTESTR